MTTAPTTEPASMRAQQKLHHRAIRLARLRRRVAATALATVAVAAGVVAYDGSTGTTATPPAAAAPRTDEPVADTWEGVMPKDDAVTTRQS